MYYTLFKLIVVKLLFTNNILKIPQTYSAALPTDKGKLSGGVWSVLKSLRTTWI